MVHIEADACPPVPNVGLPLAPTSEFKKFAPLKYVSPPSPPFHVLLPEPPAHICKDISDQGVTAKNSVDA